MKIRPVTKDDLAPIMNLSLDFANWLSSVDEYYKVRPSLKKEIREYFSASLKEKETKIFVAEDGGIILGFIIGSIESPALFVKEARIGKVILLVTKKENRKSGIGKQLFQSLKTWFEKNGITTIELSVDEANKTAISVWKKLGFKEFARRMRLYFS